MQFKRRMSNRKIFNGTEVYTQKFRHRKHLKLTCKAFKEDTFVWNYNIYLYTYRYKLYVRICIYCLLWGVLSITSRFIFLPLRRIIFKLFQTYTCPTFYENFILVPTMLSLLCAFKHGKCLIQYEGNQMIHKPPINSTV